METIQAYVTLIKDILTGLAALVAAVIGIVGLQTWKKQLRGKTEYELAQRLAKTVYGIRNGFDNLKNLLTLELASGMLELRIRIYFRAELYAKPSCKNQLQQMKEAVTELDGLLLEAEPIWGANVRQVFGPFQRFAQDSIVVISYYVEIIEPPKGSTNKEIITDFDEWSIDSDNKKDAAVRQIEDFLKPYLKI